MNTSTEYRPVTVGNWMVTLIILAIPFVNVIMYFYWAFTSSTHPSKRSYCQAVLGLVLIAMVCIGVLALFGQVARHL